MTDSWRYAAIVVGEGTTVWYALRISVGRVCGRLIWSAASFSAAPRIRGEAHNAMLRAVLWGSRSSMHPGLQSGTPRAKIEKSGFRDLARVRQRLGKGIG
jgi:hypothetical protein